MQSKDETEITPLEWALIERALWHMTAIGGDAGRQASALRDKVGLGGFRAHGRYMVESSEVSR